jgi:hypothetical protein
VAMIPVIFVLSPSPIWLTHQQLYVPRVSGGRRSIRSRPFLWGEGWRHYSSFLRWNHSCRPSPITIFRKARTLFHRYCIFIAILKICIVFNLKIL